MKRSLPLALGALLVGGCSTVTYRLPIGPVPIAEGALREFSPLVSPSSATPRCEELEGAEAGVGGRTIALVYSDPAEQQVTVMFDPDGVPTRYTDVRGDLLVRDGEVGDRTTIGLYLAEGYAVLSNRPAGERPTILEIPVDQALYADELGSPGTMLDQLSDICS